MNSLIKFLRKYGVKRDPHKEFCIEYVENNPTRIIKNAVEKKLVSYLILDDGVSEEIVFRIKVNRSTRDVEYTWKAEYSFEAFHNKILKEIKDNL